MLGWIILYAAATAADIVSTVAALRHRGQLGEGWLLRFAGRGWLPIRVAVGVLIAVLALTLNVPSWVLPVAAISYAAVAAWNVFMIARLPHKEDRNGPNQRKYPSP